MCVCQSKTPFAIVIQVQEEKIKAVMTHKTTQFSHNNHEHFAGVKLSYMSAHRNHCSFPYPALIYRSLSSKMLLERAKKRATRKMRRDTKTKSTLYRALRAGILNSRRLNVDLRRALEQAPYRSSSMLKINVIATVDLITWTHPMCVCTRARACIRVCVCVHVYNVCVCVCARARASYM